MAKVNKKVNLCLVGIDGNIFAVMGAFSKQARKEKWTKEEIDSVLNDVMSAGKYEQSLGVIMDHCERPLGDIEEEDQDENDLEEINQEYDRTHNSSEE